MNISKLSITKDKFIRSREDELVYRLYFENGCFTLSKRKCGYLIHNIIDKCKTYNARFRNDFKICGDYVEVYCYVIKTGEVKTIYLDIEDWERYHQYYISTQLDYPQLFYGSKLWRVHRLVMGLPKEIDREEEYCIVDHINGDTFDNRKSNLRIVNFEANCKNHGFFSTRNDSGVLGVTLTSNKNQWRVRFAREDKIKAVVFNKLSDAVKYRYEKGKELGFHFREGSTTIENYINELINSGK